MSSNLRWRKREAWGVRGSLFILKQYCYKTLTKTTTIIECENRTHPLSRTTKAVRQELLAELDQLAPPLPPSPALNIRALQFFYSLPAVEQHQVRAHHSADDSGFGLWLTHQYRRMAEGKDSVLTEATPDAN